MTAAPTAATPPVPDRMMPEDWTQPADGRTLRVYALDGPLAGQVAYLPPDGYTIRTFTRLGRLTPPGSPRPTTAYTPVTMHRYDVPVSGYMLPVLVTHESLVNATAHRTTILRLIAEALLPPAARKALRP